jgi:PASTA domain
MRNTLLVLVGLLLTILASSSSPQHPKNESPGLRLPTVRVPEVMGRSHAVAIKMLEEEGLDHRGVDSRGNPLDCCYVYVGRVIEQRPSAGAELTVGDVVNLTFEPILVPTPSSRLSPRDPGVIEREQRIRRDMLRSRLEWQKKVREQLIEELPADIIRALGERGSPFPPGAESRSLKELIRERVSLRLPEGGARPDSPASRARPESFPASRPDRR